MEPRDVLAPCVRTPVLLRDGVEVQGCRVDEARARRAPGEDRGRDQRAGVEGTLSQGIRAFGLREARYIGLQKTHLQHLATAAAINVVRTVRWLEGTPHAQTRTSRFAALAA